MKSTVCFSEHLSQVPAGRRGNTIYYLLIYYLVLVVVCYLIDFYKAKVLTWTLAILQLSVIMNNTD